MYMYMYMYIIIIIELSSLLYLIDVGANETLNLTVAITEPPTTTGTEENLCKCPTIIIIIRRMQYRKCH